MAIDTRRFKNELEEAVTLQVKDDSLRKVPSISIYIERPDSESEIIITKAEALELLEGLYKVLKSKKR